MRLRKITAVLVLAFTMMTAAPQKANAQFVVSDPTNLVQAILQYMQDADLEGYLGDISKLAEAKQSYTELKDRLDELKQMKDFFKSLGRVGRQLQEITAFGQNTVNAGRNYQAFLDYFSKCSDYSYYNAAANLYNLYNEMSSDILLEMNELFKSLTNMKQGASLVEYVDAVAKVTDECNTKLGLLQGVVNRRMVGMLEAQGRKDNYKADRALLNKIIL